MRYIIKIIILFYFNTEAYLTSIGFGYGNTVIFVWHFFIQAFGYWPLIHVNIVLKAPLMLEHMLCIM